MMNRTIGEKIAALRKAQKTGEMPFRLQRVQLHTMLGKNRQIRLECEKNFRESPCADTLLLYFEALCDVGYDEDILKLLETEEAVISLMRPPSSDNAALWHQCLLAALKIGDIEYVEKHRETVLRYGQDFDKFSLLWELTKSYKARNLTEKYTVTREMVLSLMPRVKLEPYIKEATKHLLFLIEIC